jgi:hypothetical protein
MVKGRPGAFNIWSCHSPLPAFDQRRMEGQRVCDNNLTRIIFFFDTHQPSQKLPRLILAQIKTKSFERIIYPYRHQHNSSRQFFDSFFMERKNRAVR